VTRRHYLTVGVVVAAVSAGGAVMAPVAVAGDYDIYNCPSANGSTSAGAWAAVADPSNSFSNRQVCPTPGDPNADWIGFSTASMNPSTAATEVLTVPAGSSITVTHVKVWWRLAQQTSGSSTFGEVDSDGAKSAIYFTPHDSTGTPDDVALSSTTKQLKLQLDCGTNSTASPCQFGSNPVPIEQIFGVQTTLHSDAAPVGQITGGTLTYGGPRSGTQTVAVHTTSAESGVAKLEVLLDGQVVGTDDYSASPSLCPHASFAACRSAVDDTVSANTAAVPDGPHTMLVRVTDTAGNITMVSGGQVTTANPFVAGPVDRGPPNGSPASDHATLTLATRRTLRAGFGKRALLRGRLANEAGRPIAGATLDVYTQVLSPGAPYRLLGHVLSGGDGGYRVVVPAGPSRHLLIGYRSHLNDVKPTALAEATETVPAAAKLTPVPRHVRNGQRVVFRGHLLGGFVPASGKAVEVQVKIGRTWRDILSTRSDRHGLFKAGYRFTRTHARVTYRFRAVIRTDSDYPYTDGRSNIARVRLN